MLNKYTKGRWGIIKGEKKGNFIPLAPKYISYSLQFCYASRNVEFRHILNTMIMELNTEIKIGFTLFTLIEIKEGVISLMNFIINGAVSPWV